MVNKASKDQAHALGQANKEQAVGWAGKWTAS